MSRAKGDWVRAELREMAQAMKDLFDCDLEGEAHEDSPEHMHEDNPQECFSCWGRITLEKLGPAATPRAHRKRKP